jgi:hypothetical protein
MYCWRRVSISTYLISCSKGRIQNSAQDLSFVDDPFPSSKPPSDSSATSSGPVLKVDYPVNGFGPMASGTQLYSLFNGSEPFQSMLLTYEIALDTDFQFIKGGKLPGMWTYPLFPTSTYTTPQGFEEDLIRTAVPEEVNRMVPIASARGSCGERMGKAKVCDSAFV